MSGPRVLDLFCGAGGAAMGYHRAWPDADITGVDNRPMPRYPFRFVQADAMEFPLDDYDFIHASPPCQGYNAMQRATKSEAPRLVDACRTRLETTGVHWIIENVEGAPLRSAVTLCGTMFGLRVRRHRLFECSWNLLLLVSPCSCKNGVRDGALIGHRLAGRVAPGRTKPPHHTESERREAIGVDWMTTMEARQAIPPAYTEYLARQYGLLARMERAS